MKPDYAREIRFALTDPRKLCDALGLSKGAERQASGLLVNCPEHGDRTPSCSVTRGPDGTIRVRCFGCQWTGDALHLIASVHDLKDFREVLLEGAQIAGLHQVVSELRGESTWEPRQPPEPPEQGADPDYPAAAEVRALWETARPAGDDPRASEELVGRKIDPDAATELGLARVLPPWPAEGYPLPSWARYRGAWWPCSGHRLIVPVYAPDGSMRSVRAWRIEGNAPAKRLPPAGRKTTGLVMANALALRALKPKAAPARLLVVEGEPDFLTAAIRWPSWAVIGVISGGWTTELAARIPFGSDVVIGTHHDDAGNKYADHVAKTVRARAVVRRMAAA